MKNYMTLNFLIRLYILLSGLALLSVSILAFISPQAVMDLVEVKLSTTDAYSSIRGVYGGVGMAIFISLVYLMFKNPTQALIFLSMLWGFYAGSRVITILIDGELGSFGNQWMLIEGIFFLLALGLYTISNRNRNHIKVYDSASNLLIK